MYLRNKLFGYLFIAFSLLLVPEIGWAQQQTTVKGKIIDEATGDVLPGINIRILGTSQGTVTNRDGYYELSVPTGDVELQFSYIGYESRTESLTGLTAGEEQTLIVEQTSSLISGGRNCGYRLSYRRTQ